MYSAPKAGIRRNPSNLPKAARSGILDSLQPFIRFNGKDLAAPALLLDFLQHLLIIRFVAWRVNVNEKVSHVTMNF